MFTVDPKGRNPALRLCKDIVRKYRTNFDFSGSIICILPCSSSSNRLAVTNIRPGMYFDYFERIAFSVRELAQAELPGIPNFFPDDVISSQYVRALYSNVVKLKTKLDEAYGIAFYLMSVFLPFKSDAEYLDFFKEIHDRHALKPGHDGGFGYIHVPFMWQLFACLSETEVSILFFVLVFYHIILSHIL